MYICKVRTFSGCEDVFFVLAASKVCLEGLVLGLRGQGLGISCDG